MKIDLHVHSAERSPCAKVGEEAQIQAAIARGLDAIALTDHNRLVPQAHLTILNHKYEPFRIFGGVEISLQESEHVLVLGVQDPALESEDWTYPQLHPFVRARGGWLAVAHPFRYRPEIKLDLERYPPDALEAFSINLPKATTRMRIRDLAAQLNLPVVCNSDAHRSVDVGRGYNHLEETPTDEVALVTALKSGAFRCVCP